MAENTSTETTVTAAEGVPSTDTPAGERVGSPADPSGAEVTSAEVGSAQDADDAETFTREYVQRLRDESAGYRQKARGADELRTRLHAELVRGTGRLADPTDLAFDPAHLEDGDALAAALDELLTRKPHLASRRVVGDVGQGAAASDEPFSLLGLLNGA